MVKEYDLNAPLEELLAVATREFGKVDFEPIVLGGKTLNILQIMEMPAYIEKLVSKTLPGSPVELPLWAKVWPAASIMVMFMASFPFRENARILEVGAGTGLVGLALATQGLKVTLSDIEPGALLFSRINVLKNGLDDRVDVVRVDVCNDDFEKRFDYVVASEIFYKQTLLAPLVEFLKKHVRDEAGCEAFLASDAKREGRVFFDLAKDHFKLMKKDVPYKDEDGREKVVSLYRLRGQD